MKNFEIVFPLLIKDEGVKYTNDSDDNGGPTKYGVTLTDVQLYVKKDATAKDVKALTLDQAKSIYKSKYWDSLHCDGLPAGVDYTCFDYGVNSGLGRPRKALQQFKTLSGTNLIDAINNERTAFLRSISDPSNPKYAHNAKYRNGWLARVERVRSVSKSLIKDNTSGPVSGTVSTISLWAAMTQYLHMHPYIIAAIAVGVGLSIWGIVHFIRNKNG